MIYRVEAGELYRQVGGNWKKVAKTKRAKQESLGGQGRPALVFGPLFLDGKSNQIWMGHI